MFSFSINNPLNYLSGVDLQVLELNTCDLIIL